ncbi:zwei Ig domain protein zig-8-like [Daphnia pulicaria]|uniref:zwei Ig domain protein zig-8-like n=1 Tax=Daphnia pulicaria TaxID=35523 RepID=UPI001EEC086F|nr:zwei Ig domain protein zig-8-like [Daphnia pulicaria]
MWPSSSAAVFSLLMFILQSACQAAESESVVVLVAGVAEDGGGRHQLPPPGMDYYHQESALLAMPAEQRDQTTGVAIKATISSSHSPVVNKPAAAGGLVQQNPPPQLMLSAAAGVTATAKNVTVAHGKTALLTCKVGAGLLDNRTQVAWIRYLDLQLLTVGNQTYTADRRFSAGISGNGDAWSLQISHVQFRDEGGYECQIGVTPRVSHYIHLSVVEPTTVILGGSEMHIDIGSTINLTCLVQHTPEPPDYVFWTHNQQTVNYDSKRGGISVMVERGATTLSSLLIQKAARRDSGVYVCSPSSAPAAQASIHILEGERPAAMYSVARRPSIVRLMTLMLINAVIYLSARQRSLL